MDKKECTHEYKLVKRFDANIEPLFDKNGNWSTITEEHRCKRCGHIKTIINP